MSVFMYGVKFTIRNEKFEVSMSGRSSNVKGKNFNGGIQGI